jgi:hypothetical protein
LPAEITQKKKKKFWAVLVCIFASRCHRRYLANTKLPCCWLLHVLMSLL